MGKQSGTNSVGGEGRGRGGEGSGRGRGRGEGGGRRGEGEGSHGDLLAFLACPDIMA